MYFQLSNKILDFSQVRTKSICIWGQLNPINPSLGKMRHLIFCFTWKLTSAHLPEFGWSSVYNSHEEHEILSCWDFFFTLKSHCLMQQKRSRVILFEICKLLLHAKLLNFAKTTWPFEYQWKEQKLIFFCQYAVHSRSSKRQKE